MGIGTVTGLSDGTVAGGIGIVPVVFELRVFFDLRAGVAVTSAGAGPAAAGLATSVPTATGVADSVRLLLRLATDRAGEKLHGCAASIELSVNLSPDFLPRNDTIVGGLPAVASPICIATAV